MDPKFKNSILITTSIFLLSFSMFRYAFIEMIPIFIRNFFENLFLRIITSFGNFIQFLTTPGGASIFLLVVFLVLICIVGLICFMSCISNDYDY